MVAQRTVARRCGACLAALAEMAHLLAWNRRAPSGRLPIAFANLEFRTLEAASPALINMH
jgi:hypothetical protein